jgi:hypothetical protein
MPTQRKNRSSRVAPPGADADRPVQADFIGKAAPHVGSAAGRHDAIANAVSSYINYRRWADQMKRNWVPAPAKP